MSRRIDVELTSARDDGSWTWRAAGAREPRGVLDGALLPGAPKVGDVVRAEADFDIEGITILAILPPKETRPEPQRIELLGPPAREEPLVTTSLLDKRERRERDGRERRPRPDRRGDGDGRGGDRRDSRGRRSPSDQRPDRERDRPTEDGRPARQARSSRPTREAREPREAGARAPRGPRPDRPRREEPARPKAKRLRPARTHRKAVLEALPAEQRPIAEQVLAGGIPALRQAVDRQNEELRQAGKPEVKAGPLVAIAEQLLPRLRTAEWRDRAEAALSDVDELDLRDLRSVVVAADGAARDEESRTMAANLREALTRRVDAEHHQWLADLATALNDGRVVRALRLSSRPPKAGALLPPDITTRLTDAAGASLTAEISTDRWATLLDALAYSPVRRAVKPAGVPASPGDDLLAVVRKLSSRLPELAAQFGVELAPEPRRGRERRPAPPPPAPAGGPPPGAEEPAPVEDASTVAGSED